ncbi:MAG: penicillin-binding transpeptidase domain-containing protein [Actinomycetota bacterium]
MRHVRAALAVALVVAACTGGDDATGTSTVPDSQRSPVIEELFADAGVEGTFVARNVDSGESVVANPERAAVPRLPASTFKILNSLVILESDVLDSVDTTVPWDGIQRDIASWNQDHSLRSGIEVSAVWVYQQLARKVGIERMQEVVSAVGYGNARVGPNVDDFWLRGDLRISPQEQLDFLEQLHTGDLPFADEHLAAVRDIIVRERGNGWTWSHKTGTALAGEQALGWLVGIAEYDGDAWVFALNLDLGPSDDTALERQIDPQVRLDIARAALVELGALPER